MSASSEPYWLSDGVLTAQNAEDATETPVAGIRGVTITPAYETTELYTADSTFRETVKQYEHNVNVEIDYVFFNMDTAQQWLGGQGTTTATASTDTSDPMLFTVERVDPSANGDVERTTEVENVVFPEFPVVDGSQDEFEEYGLSGSGRSITNLADTSGV